jgi:G3E family GTPase
VILAGGFLGAGKTTLLLAAARRLAAAGRRVGLITNDQGSDLVDTALAVQRRVPVVEVTGGCFCCRFPDLLLALEQLQRQVQPEVILAEPVGSCTDLMATVVLPIVRYYGDRFSVAPLTVLADAGRKAERFSPRVDYLYRQQLAEAEIIGLNKLDLLSADAQQEAVAALAAAYPAARVLPLAAGTGRGVDEWLAAVLAGESRLARVLEID